MIRFVLALLALLCLTPFAQAASFDCSKAATSFEKAICSHPDLSAKDEVLAQAYATALGGLSADAAASVKADQHGWLDYASRICSDDGQPISTLYTDDQATCLGGEFASRTSELEASRMQGGYRFYPVEKFLVEKDPDSDTNSYNKVATKHFLTVKIDRADAFAAAFNAMTEQLRLDNDAQMGEDAPLFDKAGNLAKGDTSADIDVSTTVKEVNSSRIMLETDTYWYGHGAAHGNYGTTYSHFLIAEARPLEASDVFKAKGWQKQFTALVIKQAEADLGDEYQGDDSSGDLGKVIVDPSRWDFTDAGISVHFNPYEVAAYARGEVDVMVSWNDLADLVTDTAQNLSY